MCSPHLLSPPHPFRFRFSFSCHSSVGTRDDGGQHVHHSQIDDSSSTGSSDESEWEGGHRNDDHDRREGEDHLLMTSLDNDFISLFAQRR